MQKYKKFYTQMVENNSELFSRFKAVHDGYLQDRKKNSQKFHALGQEVTDIIHDYERRLCAGMERGIHSQYSNKLSEKFWQEVKKEYSHIELVGVKSNLD